MKILITGSEGQLGRELIKSCPKTINNQLIKLLPLNKKKFNLLNHQQLERELKLFKPNWIINCAAYTNVEKSEDDKETSLQINGFAPKIMANTISEYGGKMLQISTDFVFDGKKNTPYLPNDLKKPLCVYGIGKALGEDAIETILIPDKRGYIIRTSWLIGCYEDNFAQKIIKLSKTKNKLKVISDQIACTTSTRNLAKACWQIITKDTFKTHLPSITHFSDAGVASWFDVAVTVLEISNRLKISKSGCNIIPIKTKDFQTKATRPVFSLLDTDETYKVLDLNPEYWKYALEKVILENATRKKLI